MAVLHPSAHLGSLHGADGSATYSAGGYTILGSANGPIEVQRRDEIPEEAAVEVIVRPAAGVGSPKERALETILHSLLRSVILVRKYPRSLIQITLQVLGLPADSTESMRPTQSSSSLPLLPHLLQTALLTLLSAALPLSTTFTAILIATPSSSSITPIAHPTPAQIRTAHSLHVFAFTTGGACLMSESSGSFSYDEYKSAYELGRALCCETGSGKRGEEEDVDMDGDGDGMEKKEEDAKSSMTAFVRGVVAEEAAKEQRWRTSGD